MSGHEIIAVAMSGAALALSGWNLVRLGRARRKLDTLEARLLARIASTTSRIARTLEDVTYAAPAHVTQTERIRDKAGESVSSVFEVVSGGFTPASPQISQSPSEREGRKAQRSGSPAEGGHEVA